MDQRHPDPDYYVQRLVNGGVSVTCHECAPTYRAGAYDDPRKPDAVQRAFLRSLRTVVCIRCRREIEL